MLSHQALGAFLNVLALLNKAATTSTMGQCKH